MCGCHDSRSDLKEKIKKVLRTHGEQQTNLTSDAAVEKITEDILQLKEIVKK